MILYEISYLRIIQTELYKAAKQEADQLLKEQAPAQAAHPVCAKPLD